jgi:hypothetical protein
MLDIALILRLCGDFYDLEETQSEAEPRVRRIKTPHLLAAEYARATLAAARGGVSETPA